ncbi:TonB-dependent receptor [Flammeovirga yaeyamensis]|uniref:TonB-dependent receptor n=1 Tax=Flammeovirga yaeyamensis TaxID=367791 RepID=A0AAX1NBN9_9BACT|nr:carboxypeptidase-like regulatory domain-containing protein [Flammeovirga yaeyamensis]MBB3697108.1 hypothetical protein [Flammeovirga yaeyamensis]NMF33771.1 TonB-dependent receptor plug domain-containing protein [Flammeovirga yaeyamensis]QWG04963.1 TonB-dependent receptor [Flammeovirga yaeyamensis]
MKKLVLFLAIQLFLIVPSIAQSLFFGEVKDESGTPIPFANVYLKEQLEGGSTDLEGKFRFSVDKVNSTALMISALGFKEKEILLVEGKYQFIITLIAKSTELDEVQIVAQKQKSLEEVAALKMTGMDVVLNASANGDLYQALQTMPGTSKVGDQTGLFVRGGDASETQTIIDGTVATHPFLGDTPNMPSRGKFDPFMFKGTSFSTGGYSAEYGQSLSSILLLETEGIPEKTSSSANLHFAGVGATHTQVWDEKTALMGGLTYNNLVPYFSVTPQNTDWLKMPEALNANAAFRHKTKGGMYKMYSQFGHGKVGLNVFNAEDPKSPLPFYRTGNDLYINNSYKGSLIGNWGIHAGLSINSRQADVEVGPFQYVENTSSVIGKTTFSNSLGKKIDFIIGTEYRNDRDYIQNNWLEDHLTSVYSEFTYSILPKVTLRVGARGEYSSLLKKTNLAPRSSLLFELGEFNQLTLGYGSFYQKGKPELLARNNNVDFQKSNHYLMNFKREIFGRTFRAEVYYKTYDQLLKFDNEKITNNGHGFARGIDLFWRDETSIGFLDYWVTYSFVDSKRDYLHFPELSTPTFVSKHNVNIIANFKIPSLRLQPGLTYSYASGRTFENPNSEIFLADRTKDYHNLDVAVNYNTTILGNFAVVFASFSNVLGFDQVYGYDYSVDGSVRAERLPSSKQSVFLGLFVTIE